jgi:hypothetical protein
LVLITKNIKMHGQQNIKFVCDSTIVLREGSLAGDPGG